MSKDCCIKSSGTYIDVGVLISHGSLAMTNWKGYTQNIAVSLVTLSRKLFPKQKNNECFETGAKGTIAAKMSNRLLNYSFEPLWQFILI